MTRHRDNSGITVAELLSRRAEDTGEIPPVTEPLPDNDLGDDPEFTDDQDTALMSVEDLGFTPEIFTAEEPIVTPIPPDAALGTYSAALDEADQGEDVEKRQVDEEIILQDNAPYLDITSATYVALAFLCFPPLAVFAWAARENALVRYANGDFDRIRRCNQWATTLSTLSVFLGMFGWVIGLHLAGVY